MGKYPLEVYSPELKKRARIGFDRITLGNKRLPAQVKQLLPKNEFKKCSHNLTVRSNNKNSLYFTEVGVTPSLDKDGIKQVAELLPSELKVKKAEIALDFRCADFLETKALLEKLSGQITKKYKVRGHIYIVYEPDEASEEGKLSLPTTYLEDGSSTSGLKIYARREKLSAGLFGGFIVRIEWTLVGSAIQRRLGLNNRFLEDLLQADLFNFVRSNLRFVHVDLEKLGRLYVKARKSNGHSYDGFEGREKQLGKFFALGIAHKELRGGGKSHWGSFLDYDKTEKRKVADWSLHDDLIYGLYETNPVALENWFRAGQKKEREELSKKQNGRKTDTRYKAVFTDYAFRKIFRTSMPEMRLAKKRVRLRNLDSL